MDKNDKLRLLQDFVTEEVDYYFSVRMDEKDENPFIYCEFDDIVKTGNSLSFPERDYKISVNDNGTYKLELYDRGFKAIDTTSIETSNKEYTAEELVKIIREDSFAKSNYARKDLGRIIDVCYPEFSIGEVDKNRLISPFDNFDPVENWTFIGAVTPKYLDTNPSENDPGKLDVNIREMPLLYFKDDTGKFYEVASWEYAKYDMETSEITNNGNLYITGITEQELPKSFEFTPANENNVVRFSSTYVPEGLDAKDIEMMNFEDYIEKYQDPEFPQSREDLYREFIHDETFLNKRQELITNHSSDPELSFTVACDGKEILKVNEVFDISAGEKGVVLNTSSLVKNQDYQYDSTIQGNPNFNLESYAAKLNEYILSNPELYESFIRKNYEPSYNYDYDSNEPYISLDKQFEEFGM